MWLDFPPKPLEDGRKKNSGQEKKVKGHLIFLQVKVGSNLCTKIAGNEGKREVWDDNHTAWK